MEWDEFSKLLEQAEILPINEVPEEDLNSLISAIVDLNFGVIRTGGNSGEIYYHGSDARTPTIIWGQLSAEYARRYKTMRHLINRYNKQAENKTRNEAMRMIGIADTPDGLQYITTSSQKDT